MVSLNTPFGTLAFASLFKPRPRSEGAEAVYNATIIFSPAQQQSAAYKALQDACIKAARDEWGDKLNLKEVRMPFRKGEEKEQFDGFNAGDTFIAPWSKNKPDIVNAQRQTVHLPEDVWAGQTIRMNVSPFAWLNSGKKGVSFGLNHVQIVKTDGPRIDGRGKAEDVFDDNEVTAEDADLF